jgi:hypothetical protein
MEVRQHPAFGSQPVPQMLGLCFGSNELRQRRRVEVPDVQLALPLSHLRPFRRHLLGLEAGPLEFGIHRVRPARRHPGDRGEFLAAVLSGDD